MIRDRSHMARIASGPPSAIWSSGGSHWRHCGRPQPLHPPAFLVDQDRRVAAHRIAQASRQAPHLVGGFEVAGEQDETPGLNLGKKGAFVGMQARAKTAEYGRRGHRVTTGMQACRSASRAEQKRRASLMSANPTARRR